jgi:hypothetical protein
METLKIIRSETDARKESDLEATEMKDNIIQRARLLLDENGKLSRKVLGKDWNAVEKRNILEELSECRVDTKEAAEGYFAKAGIIDGMADEHKKAA